MTRRYRSLVGAMAACGVVLLSGGCATGPKHEVDGSGVVHHIHASWADGYASIVEMTRKADVVIDGTVVGVSGAGQFNNGADNGVGAPAAAVPYTDFSVSVARTLKGLPTPGIVTIRQTGGRAVDGSTDVVDDDPLLVKGERAVFFLRQFGSAHYFVMGGPAGRFPVDAGGTVSELPGGSVLDAPLGPVHTFEVAVQRSAD